MPVETSGDQNIWAAFYWAVGGICSTIILGFFYLMGEISKSNKEHGQLWTSINDQGRQDLVGALETEKRFATKDDLDRLGNRLTAEMRSMMHEHELNIEGKIDRRIAEGRRHG